MPYCTPVRRLTTAYLISLDLVRLLKFSTSNTYSDLEGILYQLLL